MLDKLLEVGLLFDFYGALLTKRQQRCLELHFAEDLSLSEIAEQLGVSRQAIHDIIHRSEQALRNYETKLGLVARHQFERRHLQSICDDFAALPPEIQERADIKWLSSELAKLLGKAEEV